MPHQGTTTDSTPESRKIRESAAQHRVPVSGRGTAVIIGGGLAGTLAAWSLRGLAERIIVVERDRYPEQPDFRAGVPQGPHGHSLLESGHRALEEMMPGIRAELRTAGAISIAMSRDLRWLSSAGWMPDYRTDLALLSCTRPVLDHAVRTRVRAVPSVQFLEGTEVVGLLGSTRALIGVRVRERGNRTETRDLPAELIIDASGRTSLLPAWLAELGCAPAPEQRVDPGIAYTSRFFHRPPNQDLGFTALYLQTKAPDQPRQGLLLPVEGDRWLVSIGGLRGAEPEPGERGFQNALKQVRDPILQEVLRTAEPVSKVRGFRPGAGVRRRYERNAPDGLVVIGDAACTFNPVYGQGMTVAARGAQALRAAVERYDGIGHAAARLARTKITAASRNAWLISSSDDARFPATVGGPSGVSARVQHAFLDRALARGTTDIRVTTALQKVMTLVAPPASLFYPAVLSAVLSPRR